ncbi:MAG: hypothetical protein ABRQ37_18595 [Candidatus Eremiobacterota bacterium]
MPVIALSSMKMMLNNIERFAHNNLDTLWFIFAITSFIFIALIVWLIIACVVRKQQQETLVSSEVAMVKVLPNDPFVKSDGSGFTSDMSYKVVSQDELNASRPNYLISSSPGDDELDLLQSEIKLYEDSLLQEKDFNIQKDFISENMSDNMYGEPSGLDVTDYSSSQQMDFEERSPVPSYFEDGKKNKADFSLPEKITPISSLSSSKKSENGLKIELPRKEMPSSKKIEATPSFQDLSVDRAGPMKPMRIELPQKGKSSEHDIPPSGSKGGRIDLPRKMSN